MRRKLLTMALVGFMALSAFESTAITAFAGNTTDKTYSFNNSNPSGTGSWREKNDDTKVYVYPTAGPKIYYTVQGKTGSNGSAADRSNTVAIPLGVQGSITNYVNEKGNDYARLRYTRISYSAATTSGKWSPDSTQNYTVYN